MGWTEQIGKRLSYFVIPEWTKSGVEVGFSTRGNGKGKPPFDSLNLGLHVGDDSKTVRANRSLWLEEWDAGWDDAVIGEQVHGNRVEWIDSNSGGRGSQELGTAVPGVDGLITGDPVALMAFFADCVPLFFYHPDLKVVGLAHAGWRGTVGKIGANVVEQINAAGGKAEDLLAGIGPAIGSCCYQVDRHVADQVIHSLGKGPWLRIDQDVPDHFRLDLAQANQQILLQAGVKAENIWPAHLCTACHPQRFFSYRRDGQASGRMAGWIRIKDKEVKDG